MKKSIILFLLSFVTTVCFAQNPSVEMAADLRSSGKIYVVVAVIAVVFIGLAIYLYTIDRRIKKIEKGD